MEHEGPLLESLTHRLAECPEDFLKAPHVGTAGVVRVDALVADLFRVLEVPIPAHCLAGADPWYLSLVSVAVWLLHDPWLLARPDLAMRMAGFLSEGLLPLVNVVPAAACVNDPDRREEFVRLCLKSLGLRPKGETEEQAADRLTSLDSVERQRVLQATRQAEARARRIREQMAREAAQRAATRYTGE